MVLREHNKKKEEGILRQYLGTVKKKRKNIDENNKQNQGCEFSLVLSLYIGNPGGRGSDKFIFYLIHHFLHISSVSSYFSGSWSRSRSRSRF